MTASEIIFQNQVIQFSYATIKELKRDFLLIVVAFVCVFVIWIIYSIFEWPECLD